MTQLVKPSWKYPRVDSGFEAVCRWLDDNRLGPMVMVILMVSIMMGLVMFPRVSTLTAALWMLAAAQAAVLLGIEHVVGNRALVRRLDRNDPKDRRTVACMSPIDQVAYLEYWAAQERRAQQWQRRCARVLPQR